MVTLVKRSQNSDSTTAEVNSLSTEKPTSNQTCQLCNNVGHVASNCKKFHITQRKANPNGFQATYPTLRWQNSHQIGSRRPPSYEPRPQNSWYPQRRQDSRQQNASWRQSHSPRRDNYHLNAQSYRTMRTHSPKYGHFNQSKN